MSGTLCLRALYLPPVSAAPAVTPAPTLPEVQSLEAGLSVGPVRDVTSICHQTSDTRAGDGSNGPGRDQVMLPLPLPDLPLQCDPPDQLHHPVDPLQHPVQSGQRHHLECQ